MSVLGFSKVHDDPTQTQIIPLLFLFLLLFNNENSSDKQSLQTNSESSLLFFLEIDYRLEQNTRVHHDGLKFRRRIISL